MTDDFWGSVVSEIELANEVPTEAFENIEHFSHLEIIFYFDKVDRTVYWEGLGAIRIIRLLGYSLNEKKTGQITLVLQQWN